MRGHLLFITIVSVLATQAETPLKFQSFQLHPDAAIELRLNAAAGKHYVIEASPDLVHWAQLLSRTPETAGLELTDTRAIDFTSRYYRAVEFAPPVNDHFEASLPIVGSDISVLWHNFGATEQPGEPSHSHFDDGNRSVWWSWTPPSAGVVKLSAVGSLFNTLIAVYAGSSVGNLQAIAKQPYFSKLLQFDAQSGTPYRIAVDGNFGTTGMIHLRLRRENAGAGIAPPSVAGFSVNFEETSDPNTPPRVVQFSTDGTRWMERENGKTNLIESGTVVSYSPSGSSAVLKIEGIRGDEILPYDYVLDFRSDTEGTYRYTLHGEFRGSGRFADFRSATVNLAPASLMIRSMVATRLLSSAGGEGQTHFYAFDFDGRFHDSDGAEHGSGTFNYVPNGSTAQLVIEYENSADLVGDRAAINMTFASTTDGTYLSEYRRNDGARISIEGRFVLGR